MLLSLVYPDVIPARLGWPSRVLFLSHKTPEYLADTCHCSRQSIKKYVQANNKITVASSAAFDAQFNKAIKAGVEKGEFTQPKGKSRPPDVV